MLNIVKIRRFSWSWPYFGRIIFKVQLVFPKKPFLWYFEFPTRKYIQIMLKIKDARMLENFKHLSS
jgi:hypothetical protein